MHYDVAALAAGVSPGFTLAPPARTPLRDPKKSVSNGCVARQPLFLAAFDFADINQQIECIPMRSHE